MSYCVAVIKSCFQNRVTSSSVRNFLEILYLVNIMLDAIHLYWLVYGLVRVGATIHPSNQALMFRFFVHVKQNLSICLHI